MRVIPLTSILSHKGRGSRSLNRDDTLGLEVKEHFNPALECAIPSSTGPRQRRPAYRQLPQIPNPGSWRETYGAS